MKPLTKSHCSLEYHCDLSGTVRTGTWRFTIIKPHVNKKWEEKGVFSIDIRYLHLMDTTTVSEPMQNWQGEALLWNNNFMGHYYELTGVYKIWYPHFYFVWILCQKFSEYVPTCEILQAALKEKWKQRGHIYSLADWIS